ncbi:TRAF3-interacting protein 1-like isoform X1 [Tamandua tetradactyla]|uniref:TRAF3-interacting protein 1-like isoform X1 n=1 Tax=Tamandua tetradactyla TaxID=48850 RepID=UPI004053CEDB
MQKERDKLRTDLLVQKNPEIDGLGNSELLESKSPENSAQERLLVFELAWKKEKDIVSKEIEKLRVSIQTLCKSALSLGKVMDYIQEDVDANKLQLQHNENKQHVEAQQKEQSITDCAMEPLEADLAELEPLIKRPAR